MSRRPYDPFSAQFECFAAARDDFLAGRDSPRAYLERCLERIAEREDELKAFVVLDAEGARAAADASSARYQAGKALSPVDGLPVAIKDCYESAELPTGINSALFKGWQPDRDAAHVFALRRGGAAVLGKTVTTELTMADPGPTRNPWDPARTPGGSSSGSAAAVAARMVPVASGSQTRGSVLRPASICGVIGYKPTYGAIHRGGLFDAAPSLTHVGLLAGTLTDAWEVSHYISRSIGGDPGYPGLYGEASLSAPVRPLRLARQYTHGWSLTDDASKAAFERLLGKLRAAGVEVLEPSSAPELAAYEDATLRAPEFFFDILVWEMAWPMLEYRRTRPKALSATIHGYLARVDAMTLDDYRRALERRAELQRLHRGLRSRIDGFLTLAHIGPGQLGLPTVGTPWYNDPSSAIGAPTLSLPLLEVEGVPLGVQLMGYEHEDALLTAHARWMLGQFGSGAARL